MCLASKNHQPREVNACVGNDERRVALERRLEAREIRDSDPRAERPDLRLGRERRGREIERHRRRGAG
jgi:hypothetical protein